MTRDTTWLAKLPPAHRSRLPIDIGISPASAIVGQRARNSSHVAGGVDPELVEEVDVVPDDVGDVGVARDHDDLVVDGHAVEGALVEQLAELGVGDGAGEVEGEALLVALLEAGAGPLEVDVRRVAAAQQVGQADRLVQVVVLEVELDRDPLVGLLEGGAGGLPDGDLRLARRAHRHA